MALIDCREQFAEARLGNAICQPNMARTSNNPLTAPVDDQPSVEERWALIERVAGSEQFIRSARLRDFLLYVGKQSLKDGCPEIHEQEIGAKVFGRPASYDRSQDNIVRVNATELRKRIDSYFVSAGVHEPLVFEIPRGGYKPVFRLRSAAVENNSAQGLEEAPQVVSIPIADSTVVRSHPEGHLSHFLWATVSLVLAITSGVLFQQNRSMRQELYSWQGKPAVNAFWADFLHSHQETDIVLPDSSVGLSEEITRHPIPLSEYLNHNPMSRVQSLDISPDRKADLDAIFGHNLVTFGDVRAAQQILALDPRSRTLNFTDSRFFLADSIKRNNVILIGGKKANPWVYLFDEQMNFSLDEDTGTQRMFVANRHPQAGEQSTYTAAPNINSLVGYSVIAYLPNPSRTGNAIILTGTDSDGTNAAAEFLTSEEQLEKFRKTIHADRFPYFEVLLKTSRLSGTSFNAELVAYRTYPGEH